MKIILNSSNLSQIFSTKIFSSCIKDYLDFDGASAFENRFRSCASCKDGYFITPDYTTYSDDTFFCEKTDMCDSEMFAEQLTSILYMNCNDPDAQCVSGFFEVFQ